MKLSEAIETKNYVELDKWVDHLRYVVGMNYDNMKSFFERKFNVSGDDFETLMQEIENEVD